MYRFKSKADGDLIMMAPVGDQLLRAIGREPAPKGIIEAAALPQAIAALEQAIAAAELARVDSRRADDDERSHGTLPAKKKKKKGWLSDLFEFGEYCSSRGHGSSSLKV